MTARTLALLTLGAVAAAAGACGGKLAERAETKDDDSADQAGTGGQSKDEDSADTSVGDETSSTRTLEACNPGFLHKKEPAKPCPYITDDGRCYDTAEHACDCACPREGYPTCVWYAFLDPIEVTCETQ